jgi:aryl-alcohol dehydrogenase-like predicted oxidoreductase
MKYKLFGQSGLRVSELCLGTMTFGLEWGWGSDKSESKEVFDVYANAGGNFVDTANRYTEGTSERWLGEFIAAERDHFVLASKYSLKDKNGDPNFAGNHRKNMVRSVAESLKRLQTNHLDLLWLHAWDFTMAPEEVMRALEDLIRQGDVHHIGISDTPAWIVAQANTIAQFRGWNSFVGLQVEYSLLQRTPEADLLPMAKAFGMALTPWAPLAGGALTGKYLNAEAGRVKEESPRRNERANRIATEVVAIAAELGVSPSHVALQWTRQRDQVVIPIVGARKASQLTDNIGVVGFVLPETHFNRLQEVSQIELGFPHEFLATTGVQDVLFGGTYSQVENHQRSYLR